MGADGGTIPKRCELVRNKKKAEKVNKCMANASRWRICQMTQQVLKEPIVACPLGRLFNKESLIEALITKTISENENTKHIKSLKDLKELILTPNPAYDQNQINKGGMHKDYNISPYICPVVGLEMNGNYRFVVNWRCGCVFSEKACKEIHSDNCHKCGREMHPENLVVLNGTDEEIAFYASLLRERRIAAKSTKKAQDIDADIPSTSPLDSMTGNKNKSCKTASIGMKRKLCSLGSEHTDKSAKCLQDDPKSTNAYKSLFTSSEEAKNRPTPHWITYNPLFY